MSKFTEINLNCRCLVEITPNNVFWVLERISSFFNCWQSSKTNMVEEEKVHNIFVTNPVDMLNFVDCFVEIHLKNGETISGTVYTIDPVSGSIVLVVREKSGELSLKIILKHSVATMAKSKVPADQENVISGDIFKGPEIHPSEKNSKEDVKNWLIKNMIPVVESGDILQIDTLEIHPPYGVDQCYCSNSIVLSRIQNLLKQMPVTG